MRQKQRDALRVAIDKLLVKYENTNPELLQDLIKLKEELDRAEQNPLDYAIAAMRIAQFIEWLFDHLPPPH